MALSFYSTNWQHFSVILIHHFFFKFHLLVPWGLKIRKEKNKTIFEIDKRKPNLSKRIEICECSSGKHKMTSKHLGHKNITQNMSANEKSGRDYFDLWHAICCCLSWFVFCVIASFCLKQIKSNRSIFAFQWKWTPNGSPSFGGTMRSSIKSKTNKHMRAQVNESTVFFPRRCARVHRIHFWRKASRKKREESMKRLPRITFL